MNLLNCFQHCRFRLLCMMGNHNCYLRTLHLWFHLQYHPGKKSSNILKFVSKINHLFITLFINLFNRINFLFYISSLTVYPRIVSSLEYFSPLNSFPTLVRKLFRFSLHKRKNNGETIWDFQAFKNSKKNTETICGNTVCKRFEKLTKSNGAANVTDEMQNNTNKDLMFLLWNPGIEWWISHLSIVLIARRYCYYDADKFFNWRIKIVENKLKKDFEL